MFHSIATDFLLSFISSILCWIDLLTFPGEIISAIFQIMIWKIIFSYLTNYIQENYSKSVWYKQINDRGGSIDEFIDIMCSIPQHTISALLVLSAIYFNNQQLFCIGTLSELAAEFIGSYKMILNRLYYKTSKKQNSMFIATMFHHIAGLIVIIPINIYFSNSIYIQKTALSLLALGPLLSVGYILYSTRNIYDLRERGQFTVYNFIVIVCGIYCRFYWTPLCIYDVIYYQFNTFNLLTKIMFVFYATLINVFNILIVIIFCIRFYQYMFHPKYGKNPNDSQISTLSKYSRSMPIIKSLR